MFTALQLLELVNQTNVHDLESHLSFVYGVRSDELNTRLGAVLGALLAILASLAGVMLLAGNANGTVDAYTFWTDMLLLFSGVLWLAGIRGQASRLRAECTAAKDLVNLLRDIYP